MPNGISVASVGVNGLTRHYLVKYRDIIGMPWTSRVDEIEKATYIHWGYSKQSIEARTVTGGRTKQIVLNLGDGSFRVTNEGSFLTVHANYKPTVYFDAVHDLVDVAYSLPTQ